MDDVVCRRLVDLVEFLNHAGSWLSAQEAWMATGGSDFRNLSPRIKEKSQRAAERAWTRLETISSTRALDKSSASASPIAYVRLILDAVAIDVAGGAMTAREKLLVTYALRLADLRRDVLLVKNNLTSIPSLFSLPLESEVDRAPSPIEHFLQEVLLPQMERESAEIVMELEQLHTEFEILSMRDVTLQPGASIAHRLVASARVTALALDSLVRNPTGEACPTTIAPASAAQSCPWFGLSDGLDFSWTLLVALKRRTLFIEAPAPSIRDITVEKLQMCK